MSLACIALGSNLGDRWSHISAAIRCLRAEPGLRVIKVSPVHETAPVNCPQGSGSFLNAAVLCETERSPHEVMKLLQQIEHQQGRVRSAVNSPRTIDLDLLLYDDRVLATPELTLPHPRLHERAFVLVPLAEIAPELVHPIAMKRIEQLLAELPESERSSVVPAEKPPNSDQILKGQRVLITGSTSGIGRAMALEFARAGAHLAIHGRNPARLDETLALCRKMALQDGDSFQTFLADLARVAEVERLAEESSKNSTLDVLVCNAGADVLTGEALHWSFEQKLESLLAVDLKATMHLARNIGQRMKTNGRGCIITIGWDQAETGMEGDSGQLFAAVKGAVASFTRSLAATLAPEVRVNCIAPGWIRTAWGENASIEWQERVRRETPLGIWGLPEDVAEAALWLASPAARFVTGQTIRVNGGAVRS